jgi:putative oxidoreductase
MDQRARVGVVVLRVATASVFLIHGVARTLNGTVGGFGGFLGGWGFPAGAAIAWGITIVEIVGGAALAAGYAVRWLAAWFIVQIAAGIVMVHASSGWFVVGAGRNGVEYSVLIVACLFATAMLDDHSRRSV